MTAAVGGRHGGDMVGCGRMWWDVVGRGHHSDSPLGEGTWWDVVGRGHCGASALGEGTRWDVSSLCSQQPGKSGKLFVLTIGSATEHRRFGT